MLITNIEWLEEATFIDSDLAQNFHCHRIRFGGGRACPECELSGLQPKIFCLGCRCLEAVDIQE